jgi:hypothetical protein
MTRKPTTKSPDERRLRKQLREVLQVYAADTSKFNTDATVRKLLSLIDDEVRRERMSMAPAVITGPRDDVVTGWYKDAATWLDKPPYVTCAGKP